MSSDIAPENRFLTVPIGRLFLANALPMTLVMVMSGLLNVVDSIFLGHFVGPDALAAVGIAFPLVMLTIALSALVSGGMSSLLARHRGAADAAKAASVFAGAHGLALVMALGLIVVFFLIGPATVSGLAAGDEPVARMTWSYLAITVGAAPVQFLLGLHGDVCRIEGRAGLMAFLSIGVTLANLALNYTLIVRLGLGVAGSAWGTVLAQAAGLALLVRLRMTGDGFLPLRALLNNRWCGCWRAILLLGTPLSLGFVGIALVSATVIAVLRWTGDEDYAQTVAAYAIVTRMLGFAFLPLMAVALATQAIVGNNTGAGRHDRSDRTVRLALATSLVYCTGIEALLLVAGEVVARGFTDNQGIALAVHAILKPMVALYLFTGPVLVLALYFQAVGLAAQAAALTLIKPFLMGPALIVALGAFGGPGVIWFAFPLADTLTAGLAGSILLRRRRAIGTLAPEPAP